MFNVALDIDQVLAFHKVKDVAQGKFFLTKGTILTALKTHYIYPGAIELVRLLCLTPDVRLTFYSAGCQERNDQFVPQILNFALPEPEYQELKASIRTLSQEDLVKEDLEGSKFQKDLSKVICPEDRLANAVLIDDQTQNIAFLQLFNFIKVPVLESEGYEKLVDKMQFYNQTSGMRYLKCVLNVSGEVKLENDMVKAGRRLFIYKTDEGFDIRCIDKGGLIQIVKLCPESFPNTTLHLQSFYQKNKQSDLVVLNDSKVISQICRYVEECGGRSRKICRRANRICYVTGGLFSALFRARSEGVCLSEALRDLQFKQNGNFYFEPNFHKLQKDDLYYHYGLAKLRENSPEYQFITPHNYHQFTKLTLTPEWEQFLEDAKKNEWDFV